MAAKFELPTNEWLPEDGNKPWKDRMVLCRFEDGHFNVCYWNGMYWVGQHGMRLSFGQEPTHFYIFEKFNENEIL